MKRRVKVLSNWSRLIEAEVNAFLKTIPPAHVSQLHLSTAIRDDGGGDWSNIVTVMVEYTVDA